jgi:hypothetical protein
LSQPFPRSQQHRADGRDHSAGTPGNVLGRQIGEVEGRRDEVGHNVDADGGNLGEEKIRNIMGSCVKMVVKDDGPTTNVNPPSTTTTGLPIRATSSIGSVISWPNTGMEADTVTAVSREKKRKLTGSPDQRTISF